MKGLVHRIIQWFMRKKEKEEIKTELIRKIIMPKKIKKQKKTIVDLDLLRNRTLKITHLIMHHSTTKDGWKNDWRAIDIYHRSFRMNWTIMVRPITDLVILDDIRKGKEKNIIKISSSYYDKEKVEKFYRRASALIGEELYIGQYVSKYTKGTKFESPWRAIGYTMGIERENGELVVRYGRNLTQRQAHCYQNGMNEHAIGFLIVGDFDGRFPDIELWKFAIKVIREIKKEIKGIKVLGHREVKGVKKSCPGELWDMKQFREDLKIRRR